MSDKQETSSSTKENVEQFGFFNVLKTQLLKLLTDFTRELDISFDYVQKDRLKVLTKRIVSCENNDIKFKELYSEILSNLSNYKNQLQIIGKEKIRTHELEFLNDIVLLGFPFKIFTDEKKNTKKTLVNYLHEFYNLALFLNNINDGNNDMFETIQNMVKQLTINPPLEESSKKRTKSNKRENHNHISDNLNLGNLGNLDLSNVNMDRLQNTLQDTPLFEQFNELMQNKDIMNIATELTSEIQMSDIDPMSIMGSLMTGNMQDNKLNNLINKISNKITKKINDGDIDKDMLENHATQFITNLSENKDSLMSLVTNMNNMDVD